MKRVCLTLTLLIGCLVYTTCDAGTISAKADKRGAEEIQGANILLDKTNGKELHNGEVHSDSKDEPIKLKALGADCMDLLLNGVNTSGIYQVYPESLNGSKKISVYCDMTIDGGGWTVFQRRDNQFKPRIDFYRDWIEYKDGFGLLDQEFWLGLENIRTLVPQKDVELRIDLTDYEKEKRHAKYSHFALATEDLHYRLNIGSYSGDAGDSLSFHNHMAFTTKDIVSDLNCAVNHHGAWWYNNCELSNLNGYPHQGAYEGPVHDGIIWYEWHGDYYSLKKTEMKFRRKI